MQALMSLFLYLFNVHVYVKKICKLFYVLTDMTNRLSVIWTVLDLTMPKDFYPPLPPPTSLKATP
jgi:hypothetical protein